MAESNVRNVSYNADGSIQCEVKHPNEHFGWVEYTARSDDPNARGQRIWSIAKAMVDGTDIPEVQDEVIQPPSPEQALHRARLRNRSDKLDLMRAMKKLGRWDAFKAALDESGAQDEWDTAGSIRRLDPVFCPLMDHIGMGDDEQDIAFGMRRMMEAE